MTLTIRTVTVFSVIISVSDSAIGSNYSDIRISRGCSGMGTSGICSTSLSFSVPAEDYVSLGAKKASDVMIVISGKNFSVKAPKFYVDSRIFSGGKVNFVCYDRMAFADSIYFNEKDVEYIESEHPESVSEKRIAPMVIYELIASKMGLSISGGLEIGCIKDIDYETLPGTSCAEWLERLSAVQCGFFYISNEDKLCFARFNTQCGFVNTGDEYTEPEIGATLVVNELIVTNGSKSYEYGSDDTDVQGGLTLFVNGGNLVDKRTSEVLSHMVLGADYTYGSIDRAIVRNIPHINSSFDVLLVKNISISVEKTGMYASLSANQAGGGEIGLHMGKITRQLENAIKANERIGKSCEITRYQGIHYVEDDEEEDEED